ncbi:hypothetical protein ACGFZB_26915 [Streptomyces cinerochromogenes]|uniref:Uncharacterized protein n=1 Tax=Streptomyces cinerochromogenes TaxID=66422 RepID=A0ABW7B9X3_9ACTN
MDARPNPFESPVANEPIRHVNAAGQILKDSPPPATTQELVRAQGGRSATKRGQTHVSHAELSTL